MDTSEELSPIDEEIIRLEEQREAIQNEYMNLQPKENDISSSSEDNLYKIEEKIRKAKLRLIKRGIKI